MIDIMNNARRANGNHRDAILVQLAKDVQAFVDSFEPPKDGGRRTVHLTANNRLLAIRRFPLPDRFLPADEIDLVIDLKPVPAGPPVGFHIIEKGNRPIIDEIRAALGGHVFGAQQGLYETHKFEGGIWICHHYAGHKWRFNAKHPAMGDNLVKFLETFFARIM